MDAQYKIKIKGEVNPACRFILNEYMKKYDGDWNKVMNHIRVKRLTSF
jgi:serine protein kinase